MTLDLFGSGWRVTDTKHKHVFIIAIVFNLDRFGKRSHETLSWLVEINFVVVDLPYTVGMGAVMLCSAQVAMGISNLSFIRKS